VKRKPARKRTAAKSPPSDRTLRGKIQAMLAAREAGRAQYRKAAAIQAELVAVMKPNQEIELGGGQVATLVDNFADTNRLTGVAYVSRFDITVRHTV